MVRDEVISIYYREGSGSDSLDLCDAAKLYLLVCVQTWAAELCDRRLNLQENRRRKRKEWEGRERIRGKTWRKKTRKCGKVKWKGVRSKRMLRMKEEVE